MKSIKNKVIHEIIINKSRFITVLTPFYDKNELNQIIYHYKEIYKDATHYCFGYILGPYSKCSDDGEPSGTAGKPILQVLENHELTNVLCLVIRYFGGIKLGAGGLLRAYSKSVSEALKKATILDVIDGYYLEIAFKYDDNKFIDHLLKEQIVTKEFGSFITYKFQISKKDFEKIEVFLKEKAIIKTKEPIQFV